MTGSVFGRNDKLLEFFRSGRKLHFHKHEILLRAGDTPLGVYCIVSGHIKVYTLDDNGDENIHIIYKAGEIFPIVWVFKNTIKNAFYEALDDVIVWRASQNDLVYLARTRPDISFQLMQQVIEQFSVYADRVETLGHRSAEERVIYRILFLAARFGKKTDAGIEIDVPLTHQTISGSINIARETASRIIEKLEASRLLIYQNRHITIPDVARLQSRVSEPVDLGDTIAS